MPIVLITNSKSFDILAEQYLLFINMYVLKTIAISNFHLHLNIVINLLFRM
ncbi:hypothetical protein D3C76_1649700 [compost metagenome]